MLLGVVLMASALTTKQELKFTKTFQQFMERLRPGRRAQDAIAECVAANLPPGADTNDDAVLAPVIGKCCTVGLDDGGVCALIPYLCSARPALSLDSTEKAAYESLCTANCAGLDNAAAWCGAMTQGGLSAGGAVGIGIAITIVFEAAGFAGFLFFFIAKKADA
jgi:hypothetical protein